MKNISKNFCRFQFVFLFLSSFTYSFGSAVEMKHISVEYLLQDTLPIRLEKTSVADTLQEVKIIGVGDMMLGTNFPNSSYLPPNDGRDILAGVKGILQTGDITFGNLEGVLLTGDGPVKKCSDPSVCYAFKTPDHYIDYLLDAGFNLLSVANNHVNDFGAVGVSNTLNVSVPN